jgi:MFS family permease
LKRALDICFLATPLVFALRSILPGMPALLASAFAGGFFFSLFAVCMAPAVAALTSARSRAKGFSVLTSTGIGMGLLSSLIGARVPGWILHAGLAPDALHAKQLTLLIACAISGLGLWPLARLRLESPAAEPKSPSYPLNPFMRRFLLSVGIAGLGLGAFDPFFNAYLSRQFHLPVDRIGLVFSLSQGLQVIAVLLSPLLLRRLGLVRGVAFMQLASAVAVAAIASAPVAAAAALFYALHTSFQYMDDPGVYSLVMNQVSPAQRGGASALQYLVAFTAQAISAAIAGRVLAKFGYPPALAGAAVLGATAAFLFWRLLRKFDQGKIAPP